MKINDKSHVFSPENHHLREPRNGFNPRLPKDVRLSPEPGFAAHVTSHAGLVTAQPVTRQHFCSVDKWRFPKIGLQCEAPKIAKLVYNSNIYGL